MKYSVSNFFAILKATEESKWSWSERQDLSTDNRNSWVEKSEWGLFSIMTKDNSVPYRVYIKLHAFLVLQVINILHFCLVLFSYHVKFSQFVLKTQ